MNLDRANTAWPARPSILFMPMTLGKHHACRLLTLAFLSFPLASQDEAEPPAEPTSPRTSHLLRLQLVDGQQLHYRIDTVIDATLQRAKDKAKERVPAHYLGVELTRSIHANNAGDWVATEHIERLRAKHGRPAGVLRNLDALRARYYYDSDHDDAAPPFFADVATTLATDVVATIDVRGRLGKRAPCEQIEQLQKRSVSRVLDTQLLLLDELELPDAPVHVGDTWTGTPRNNGIPALIDRYKLISVADHIAVVEREHRAGYGANDDAHGTLRSTTRFELDLRAGRILRAEIAMQVTELLNGLVGAEYAVQRRLHMVDQRIEGSPWPSWRPVELEPPADQVR